MASLFNVIIPLSSSLFHAHLGGRSLAEGGIELLAGRAFLDGEGEPFGLRVAFEGGDVDGVAWQDVGLDYLVGQVVLDVMLDGAFQRTGTGLLVPPLAEDEVLGLLVDVDAESHVAHPLKETL